MTAPENKMAIIEIARRMAELGALDKALEAYVLSLRQEMTTVEERLEAACAILQFGGDYKIAYDTFLALYSEGIYKDDILSILNGAFYEPNVKEQEKQYKKNCKLLKNYPYLFRKDFVPFEELPMRLYPYDDNGVLPFRVAEERFDIYTNVNDPQITCNFFRDLSKPVLAKDVFSQYELEYLRDNVRRSDWVGYENHIYLHYSDWDEFCAWLQVLDWKPLLEDEKFVILIGEEEALYPIDFKERFGIDYSQYPVKPFHIREINKVIWHTQLSAHNGGDFFNEIFHEHPNLIVDTSLIFSTMPEVLEFLRVPAEEIRDSKGTKGWSDDMTSVFSPVVLEQLSSLQNITMKDAMVAFYLGRADTAGHLDRTARIVPALFFQPHFHRVETEWKLYDGAIAVINEAEKELRESGLLDEFRYIKTFTPLRRPTTSYAATVRYNWRQFVKRLLLAETERIDSMGLQFMDDALMRRIFNRSFMVALGDRLFADSRVVRFEDAKLEPKATFTALAEFLDLPYTESMTYCSDATGRDPHGIGFDAARVYRVYERFCDNSERRLLEYLLRDVYETYGYSYEQYDGEPMTGEQIDDLLGQCTYLFWYVAESWKRNRDQIGRQLSMEGEELNKYIADSFAEVCNAYRDQRKQIIRVLCKNPVFCNEMGERLALMKQLALDPALMENPLYH